VKEALSSLPWVKKVDVKFDRKQAIVTAEPSKVDEKQINEALKAKGDYSAKIVK
jgi:copper chaperone CopZ